MARVKLAHWHGGLAPGSELDVRDEDLAALRHDGRVAEVLEGPGAEPAPSTAEPVDPGAGEAEPAVAESDQAEPTPSGRKRR
jgi:hypothetical protein